MHLETITEAVPVPEGVTAEVAGSILTVKGQKGELSKKVGTKRVSVEVKDGQVVFTAKNATKREKRSMRTGRAHARNMIRGVTEGHVYKLKICSGHFPMTVGVKDGAIEVKNFIGEKVPRVLPIREGCEVQVQGEEIVVESADKDLAGSQAAAIELLCRRPGFDTRIFQDGIYITVKDGKKV